MNWELILFFVAGGVVSTDTQAAFQLMIAQPLIACTIVGSIFGEVTAGLTIGLIFHLPYLAEIPVGGRNLSFGNLAALIASGLFISITKMLPGQTEIVLLLCVTWGFFISWVTSPLLKMERDFNMIFQTRADKAALDGQSKHISLNHYLAVVATFVFGVAFTLIFYYMGKLILTETIQVIPTDFVDKLFLLKPVLFGAGLGAVAYIFVKRQSIGYTILGAGVCVVLLLIKYSM